MKVASGTIKNKAKEQKFGWLCIILATLGAILLGYLLTGNVLYAGDEVIWAGEWATATSQGQETTRARQNA